MNRTFPILFALVVGACPPAPVERAYFVLPDASAGVTAEGRAAALTAIESTAEDLQRGDSLTIVVIQGDAQADAPGHILRFQLAKERQAFDEDRDRLVADISARVSELMVVVREEPSQNTDVLGTFALVAEELEGRTAEGRGFLAQMYARFSPQRSTTPWKRLRMCGGRYLTVKSSVA